MRKTKKVLCFRNQGKSQEGVTGPQRHVLVVMKHYLLEAEK